jgi:L-alanine-DL-glutamate epimerase-like enolase superfamily enzyme
MKIAKIEVFQVNYKLLDREYAWSRGQSVSSFVSTIVRITTDTDLKGYAEVCPLGSAYMDAYARGIPAGVEEIGSHIIGQDPCQLNNINHMMDMALLGHNYVKSPMDIACWDIFGQITNTPLCTLLGGRAVDKFPLYRAISQGTPEKMADDVAKYRAEGYRRFQLKVGSVPEDDVRRTRAVLKVIQPGDVLVADANTGWIPHKAIRVVSALEGEDVYIEQPCPTLEECLIVRAHTPQPMVLDEVIRDVPSLMRAFELGAMDVVNLKISRLGGLTKAKQMRDLCQSLGIAMTIEDSWGGDITTAAIAHLAGSTKAEYYFTSTDFNSYNDVRLAEDAPTRKQGWLEVPAGSGLGIHVREDLLGEPVVTVS